MPVFIADNAWYALFGKEGADMKTGHLNRITAVFTALILAVSAAAFTADAETVYAGNTVYLGSCGTNLSANLETDTHTLKIELDDPSGDGLMASYGGNIDNFPWASRRSEIESIEVGHGVTRIDGKAFMNMPNLQSVLLPSTLTYIGNDAFAGNGYLYFFFDGKEEVWEIRKNSTGFSGNDILLTSDVHFLDKGTVYIDLYRAKNEIQKELGSEKYAGFITCFYQAANHDIIGSLPPDGYGGSVFDIDKDGHGDIGIKHDTKTGYDTFEILKGNSVYGEYHVPLSEEANAELFGIQRYSKMIFNITNDLIHADVKVTPSSSAYTGKAQKPKVSVSLFGRTLKEGTDYTLSYADNKMPGQAGAIVKGKNKYKGTGYGDFLICYKDVPATHAYSKAVYWATGQNIAAGYSGAKTGIFGVNDEITRGQVVTFLWRAAGRPNPSKNTQTFKDVPVSHAFYKAIQWASEAGITGGYTGSRAGYFGPNDSCTRGQIAMFLWRFAGKPEPESNKQTFKDVPVSHSFYKAIQWASERGITAGYKDGTFGVNKGCTRGHCVTFMYRQLRRG